MKLAPGAHIDESAKIYGGGRVRIGAHSRVDAAVIISSGEEGIDIGNYCHIGAGTIIIAAHARFIMEDFSGLSVGVRIFTSSDDYSGGSMTNPTVPSELRNPHVARVAIGRHAVVGANSVIMPGVRIGSYSAVGALSLVSRTVPDGVVVGGVPLRILRARDRESLRRLESEGFGNNG